MEVSYELRYMPFDMQIRAFSCIEWKNNHTRMCHSNSHCRSSSQSLDQPKFHFDIWLKAFFNLWQNIYCGLFWTREGKCSNAVQSLTSLYTDVQMMIWLFKSCFNAILYLIHLPGLNFVWTRFKKLFKKWKKFHWGELVQRTFHRFQSYPVGC